MVQLDDIIRAGAVSIAALSEQSVHHGTVPSTWILGTKRPVAVLIRRDDETLAFEANGSPIAFDDLEKRFPGGRAEFERRVMDGASGSR